MRISEHFKVDAFTIYEAPIQGGPGTLDPINVLLRDFCGSGQVIVECYGAAWSCWFGAIGSGSLTKFIAVCDEYYLADKLGAATIRPTAKREQTYLQHIARAVIAALKGGAA